ncbi:sugar phosphate isomerase/epimerase family protein [Niallia sp. Krafla_26]|uniref:sugar phosphate isomerase/epimerase family protein n=1 Tax=Niallia sp. Krafla_26 TaxID=3064703 RepID=UPI003D168C74
MKKGYHIPLHLTENQIVSMGEKLLGEKWYEAIEIKFPFNDGNNHSDSYVKGIRYLINEFSPMVSMHIPTNLDLGHGNTFVRQTIIDQIKESIDFAQSCGAIMLPIHPGTIGTMDIPVTGDSQIKERLIKASENKKQKARELTIEALVDLSDYISSTQMILTLENVLLPQEIVYSANDLDSILKEVDRPNVKALFDCGHAYRCGIEPAKFINELQSEIAHIHVNDNDGTCDLHLSIGEGTIDYGSMFNELKNKNYQGTIVMETGYDSAEDLIEDAKRLQQYIEG